MVEERQSPSPDPSLWVHLWRNASWDELQLNISKEGPGNLGLYSWRHVETEIWPRDFFPKFFNHHIHWLCINHLKLLVKWINKWRKFQWSDECMKFSKFSGFCLWCFISVIKGPWFNALFHDHGFLFCLSVPLKKQKLPGHEFINSFLTLILQTCLLNLYAEIVILFHGTKEAVYANSNIYFSNSLINNNDFRKVCPSAFFAW